ncbi:MAG: nucleotidyltransferase domain-containing protein [Actinomycetota bacterium]
MRVAELMSTFRPWWALCGGWAVDAWIGEQTRDHVDIDIATFADDQRAVFEQLSGWNLIAHDAIVDQETTEPWDGRRLVLPAHVHAHSDGDVELEVLINERSHDDWVLSAEPPIVVPISSATAPSP